MLTLEGKDQVIINPFFLWELDQIRSFLEFTHTYTHNSGLSPSPNWIIGWSASLSQLKVQPSHLPITPSFMPPFITKYLSHGPSVFSQQATVRKKSSISIIQLIFIICNDYHPSSSFTPFIHTLESICWLRQFQTLVNCHCCYCCTLCSLSVCMCMHICCLWVWCSFFSELPADSLLFFRKLSVKKNPVFCVEGLFNAEQSMSVLEDTALRYVCLRYQS